MWSQGEPQVGYMSTFVQVDLQVVLVQPHQYLFQRFEVPFVSVGVDQHVVNVYQNVLQSSEYLLHYPLEALWAAQ